MTVQGTGGVHAGRAGDDAGPRPRRGTRRPTGRCTTSNSDLAMSLRDVARLIKADVGLQVAAVDYGDWDMHEGLADGHLDPTQGWMHDKLTELLGCAGGVLHRPRADADRQGQPDHAVGVRPAGRGERVARPGPRSRQRGLPARRRDRRRQGARRPGRALAPAALDDGDLAATTDYRNLIGELLVKRCGSSATSVFPGLSLLRARHRPLRGVRSASVREHLSGDVGQRPVSRCRRPASASSRVAACPQLGPARSGRAR